MRGLLVFNDNHELLYSHCDKQLRSLLRRRQCEFQSINPETTIITPESSSTAGGDDSITTAYIFLPLIVCYQSMKCMKFDRYLSIRSSRAICFYFAEYKMDTRLLLLAIGGGDDDDDSMESLLQYFMDALEFSFGPLASSIAHPRMERERSLLDFCLQQRIGGPKVRPTVELLENSLRHVDASEWFCCPSPTDSAQSSTFDNKAGGGSNLTNTSTTSITISSALARLCGQLHTFLRCQVCLLIRNGSIVECFSSSSHASSNGSKQNEKNQTLVKAANLITLIRTAREYGKRKNSTGAKQELPANCSYCYSITFPVDFCDQLQQQKSAAESGRSTIFSDVFLIDFSPDLYLLCVSPSTHGDLMYDLTDIISAIERLDQLRFERSLLLSRATPVDNQAWSRSAATANSSNKLRGYYDFWFSRLDTLCRHFADRLDDRLLFMEAAEESKVVGNFRALHQNLRRLTMISAASRRKPLEQSGGRVEREETVTLKSLRLLASALLFQTYRAAIDEAGRYKLEKLERCWKNLRLSSHSSYAPIIANLVDSLSSRSISISDHHRTPSAGRFALDALAYVVVLPERRLYFTNGFSLLEQEEIERACRTLKKMVNSSRRNSNMNINVEIAKSNHLANDDKTACGHLQICMEASKESGKSDHHHRRGLWSKLASAISGLSTTDDEDKRESSSSSDRSEHDYPPQIIKEPFVIWCAYEGFINVHLALRQTRELALHLYGFIESIRTRVVPAL